MIVNVRHFNEYPRHVNPLVVECSDKLFSQIKTKIVKIISELPITQQQLFYFSPYNPYFFCVSYISLLSAGPANLTMFHAERGPFHVDIICPQICNPANIPLFFVGQFEVQRT